MTIIDYEHRGKPSGQREQAEVVHALRELAWKLGFSTRCPKDEFYHPYRYITSWLSQAIKDDAKGDLASVHRNALELGARGFLISKGGWTEPLPDRETQRLTDVFACTGLFHELSITDEAIGNVRTSKRPR